MSFGVDREAPRACAPRVGRTCVDGCIDAIVTGFGAELPDMLLQGRYVGIFQTISLWAGKRTLFSL